MISIPSLQSRNIHRQHGLSLVELMISLVISMILLLGIASLVVQQNSTRDELEKSSRQIENGRYAMQLLHDDIQHAGFYGQYFTPPAATFAPNALPDPCATTVPALLAALPLPIQGYNNLAAVPAPLSNCLNSANFLPGTDILVIRRADSNRTTIAAAAAAAAKGLVYLQANAGNASMGTGATSNAATFPLFLGTQDVPKAVEAPLRAYTVRIYFISPCSVATGPLVGGNRTCKATDDNGRPIPTLKRLELADNGGGATVFTMTPLVEGIEDMQLSYGVDGDTTVPVINPVSAPTDGFPDSYCNDPDGPPSLPNCTTPNNLLANNPTNWANVMAVRVNFLARNTECSSGYADSKTYAALGLTAQANSCPNGSDYKRHAFSELVRVVNASGRRAQL